MQIQRLSRHQAGEGFSAPFFISQVQAGFPSPAEDYMDGKLDLNDHLIRHPAATFYCRVSGGSMAGLGIYDGDLLIVDRAVEAKQGDVVLAAVDGDLTCKILDVKGQQLLPANPRYEAIKIKDGSEFQIEGVVIHSIRSHHVRP